MLPLLIYFVLSQSNQITVNADENIKCPYGAINVNGKCVCQYGRGYNSHINKCQLCPMGQVVDPETNVCSKCKVGLGILENGICGACPKGQGIDNITKKCRICDSNHGIILFAV